jgi:hypothetical protein
MPEDEGMIVRQSYLPTSAKSRKPQSNYEADKTTIERVQFLTLKYFTQA